MIPRNQISATSLLASCLGDSRCFYISICVSQIFLSPKTDVLFCLGQSELFNVGVIFLLSLSVSVRLSRSFHHLLTNAVVVETKQMVVVLAVTEVNEDVVVQYLSWKILVSD